MKPPDSGMHLLETRVLELEKVQIHQMTGLKMSVVAVVESLSPSNMLRSALKDIAHSPGLRSTTINTAIGIGAGFLGKKIYVGGSGNILKKITGTAVGFLIANFVRKRIPEMKENNLQHSNKNFTALS